MSSNPARRERAEDIAAQRRMEGKEPRKARRGVSTARGRGERRGRRGVGKALQVERQSAARERLRQRVSAYLGPLTPRKWRPTRFHHSVRSVFSLCPSTCSTLPPSAAPSLKLLRLVLSPLRHSGARLPSRPLWLDTLLPLSNSPPPTLSSNSTDHPLVLVLRSLPALSYPPDADGSAGRPRECEKRRCCWCCFDARSGEREASRV